MSPARYAEKFTDSTGSSIVFTFPLNIYEWQSGPHPISLSSMAIPGADFDYDQLGTGLAPKRNAIETVRFTIKGTYAQIEDKIAEARQECYRIGRGKLWVLDSTGDRWWAWARIAAMPEMRLNSPFLVPMSISFIRMSDWYNDTETTGSEVMNGASESFNITNAGNARVYNALFILKGTFVNPVITNTTNGYIMQSSRDGSAAGHWLKFDAGKYRVEFATDSGVTYAADFANFVRQSAQIGLMVLEPGVNAFTAAFGGTPSGTFDYSFYPAYH